MDIDVNIHLEEATKQKYFERATIAESKETLALTDQLTKCTVTHGLMEAPFLKDNNEG